MKLKVSPPLPNPIHTQLDLFFLSKPLGNHGHVRTTLGSFAELLTCKLFDASRHQQSSTFNYCPDISKYLPYSNRRLYIECKTCGRTNQTFIYSGRLLKDLEFSRKNILYYAIYSHNTDTLHSDTVEDLQYLFLKNLKCLYFVPFEVIYEQAMSSPACKLNSKYGRSDKYPENYGEGRRISLKNLEEYIMIEFQFNLTDS